MKVPTLVKVTGGMVAVITAGILVAVVAVAQAEYSAKHWTPPRSFYVLAVFTTITFVEIVRRFRGSWMRPRWWFVVCTLLALHLIIYTVLLLKVPEWRILWFVPISFAELLILEHLLQSLGLSAQHIAF